MRNSTFLEEELRLEDIAACTTVLSSATDNFGALVAAAGMNPHTDFINADLSGCDLSDTDLRGFNFSGADLRGVIVRDARWDRTTNFNEADISGTPFVFGQTQKKFFQDNPHHERMVRSLTSSDWLGVEIWLGKDRDSEKETRAAAHIAFEVYEKTDQPYIKTIILYYARYQFTDQLAYRDFLLSELGRSNPPGVLASCLNIVGRLFAEDWEARSSCQAHLAHQSVYVRKAALAALMNGIRGATMPHFLQDYIRSEPDGDIRRYYLGRVARRISHLHDAAMREERSPSLHRDFLYRVTDQEIYEIADRPSVRAGIVALEERKPAELGDSQPPEKGEDKRAAQLARREKVRQVFDDFIHVGIPFQVD